MRRVLRAACGLLFLCGHAVAQTGTGYQQPGRDIQVQVAANTPTMVYNYASNGANFPPHYLRIVPNPVGSSCFMQHDGSNTVSANSTPIPGGYVWNNDEPPPAAQVWVFCTTAVTMDVSYGN